MRSTVHTELKVIYFEKYSIEINTLTSLTHSQIEPEMLYTASAILDGIELSYFGQEGLSEVTTVSSSTQPVTFQFQCSSESTNGTGVQGGQIPELVFYGPSSSNED